MSRFAFTQVDVFTATALRGNPLAVVHGADALDEARMQAFARWTNLSETTFLLAPTDPGADYRVRIFTPGGELPFAGHPTLGSCHAWRERGGRSKVAGEVVQQCGVGLVRIKLDGAGAAFARAAAGARRGRRRGARRGPRGARHRSRSPGRRAVPEERPELAQPRARLGGDGARARARRGADEALRVGRRRRRASGGQRVRVARCAASSAARRSTRIR